MGFIKSLQAGQTSTSLYQVMQPIESFFIETEASLTPAVGLLLAIILRILKDGNVDQTPLNMTCYVGPVSSMARTAGFSIGTKEDNSNRFQPLVVGELKGPGFDHINLSMEHCDSTAAGKESGSQRHANHSVIRQQYNYMLVNGLLVGIYTNYYETARFFRDCSGNLLITPSVRCDAVGDLGENRVSTAQLLALDIMIANERCVPVFEILEDGVLVECDGNGTCKGHKKLPMDCQAKFDHLSNREKGVEPASSPNDDVEKLYAASLTPDGSPISFVDLGERELFCLAGLARPSVSVSRVVQQKKWMAY